MDVIVPEDPGYVGALGAAIAASTGTMEEEVEAKVIEKDDYQEG